MKTNKKIMILLMILGLSTIIYYYNEIIAISLYYYFLMMGDYTIQLIQQDEAGYAVITFILQILAWAIFVIIFKFTVINMLFPKIRIVDELKNAICYARKIVNTEGEDPRFVYIRIKFKFFPVFRWHTFKIPKPEYHKKKKLKNGVPNVIWRRMPSSIDVITKELNIKWNELEKVYELTPDYLPRIDEDVNEYREKTRSTIHRLSGNVTEAIRGDSGLLKDKYQMGMPLPAGLFESEIPKKKIETMKDAKTEKDIEQIIDAK